AEDKLKRTPPPEVVGQAREPWPSQEAVEVLFGMTWRFISTEGPSYFLTSDNPAFLFEGVGLENVESELTFPISSSLALHGCWQPAGRDRVIPLPQKAVKALNRRAARSATRFIFYREHAEWIAWVANRAGRSSPRRIQW